MAEMVKIRIDQDVFDLDFDSLTLGELELIEREFDQSITGVDLASARGILVIAWIAKRRANPLSTLDELRALPSTAVELVEEDETVPLDDAEEVVTDERSGIQS